MFHPYKSTRLPLIALATFLACAITGSVAWRSIPASLRASRVPIATIKPPAAPDQYLAYYRGESLSHSLHYFGTSDVANQHLRDAQILFVGSSRLLYGLPQETLQPWFAQRQTPYYVLGFLYGETSSFAHALIERHDLRPKWVIANADSFFTGRPSAYARDMMRHRTINAHQVKFETETTFAATRALHQFLPHLNILRQNPDNEISFRSLNDGTMTPLATYHDPAPVNDSTNAPPVTVSREELAAAQAFKQALEKRGARLLLTYIPRTDSHRANAEALARALNVPFVSPRVDGLQTLDRSHLDKASAAKFSTALLADLDKIINGK